MWPPTVYELVWPQGLFGWPPDHMGWFALLLLVKFKTPGWFYFISYSYQVAHFGGWEHCVKEWWVTRSKSKVSRPLFSLVLVAWDMICFVVKVNLNEKGSVKQTSSSTACSKRSDPDLGLRFPNVEAKWSTNKLRDPHTWSGSRGPMWSAPMLHWVLWKDRIFSA